MTAKPIPYPPDTKAKGWRFELDYEAIDQSDTWDLAAEIPMAQHTLLMMWYVAWKQEPCGSLPNDEAIIRAKCKVTPKLWDQCRGVLMRNWWLAEDGRLYHDTIVTRVLALLEKRANDSKRTRDNRARRAASLAGNDGVTRDTTVSNAAVTGEFDTKHQAPSTSTEEEKPPKPPRKRRASAAAQQAVSIEAIVADGVLRRHADEWLAIRAKKGLLLTQTAWDDIKVQAGTAGLPLDEAIRQAVVNSWGGFKAKWLTADVGQSRTSQRADGLSAAGAATLQAADSLERKLFGEAHETA